MAELTSNSMKYAQLERAEDRSRSYEASAAAFVRHHLYCRCRDKQEGAANDRTVVLNDSTADI